MVEIMKKMPALIFDRGMSLPEISVTANYPSTMNGSKDLCHWSREDRKLAATVGKLAERVFGRYGKGLVKAALGESLYEKGEDTYEILTLLARAKMEAESGGMTEIAFAAVGLQVRLDTLQGQIQTATEVLASFEKSVREQGAVQLLPNIAALQCRLALYQGDREAVRAWMGQAPDEDREFCILECYRYLTKVRCYLSLGEYLKAQALLEKLRYYAEKCKRTYIRMEVRLLSAMAKYRTGGEWKGEFLSALQEACSCHFIRLVSEEGAAAQELFAAAGKRFLEKEIPDKAWLFRLMEETGKVAVRYPVYLKGQLVKAPDFCEAALSVLRMQAEGKSMGTIAQELSMKEATVKYHAKENYRKLGVSGKADAVLAAAMIFQALPFREAAISSASESRGSGLCEHHAEHTADCGYAEAEPEQKCTHEHTEECYRTVGEEDGSPAKEPDCRHEHDESCGYREETPAGPCTFVCEICNGGILEDDEQENDSETGTPGTENEEEIKETESGQEESVCPIEELIAALPDAADVTEDNADDVRVQLEEILALFTELTENEQEQLDLARCYELQEALDAGSVSVPLAVETENNPRLDVSRGRIWIGGDSLGSYYIQSQTDYRPVKDDERKYYTGTVTITGTATSGSYRSIKVDGEKGSSYQIVLDNVALYASEGGDGTPYAGMEFADAAYDIILTLRGNNTLQRSMVSKTGAIQRPGLYMYAGSLTIQGSGTLNLTGGTNPNGPSLQGGDGLCINSAKLTIKDGAAVHARGGNPDRNPGDGMWGDKLASVVLENGILDLQGHYGIGGGGASNPIVVKGDRTEIISLSGQGIADHLSVKLEAGNGWYGVVQSGKDSSSPGGKQYIAPDSSYTTEDARWHRITMDNAKYSLDVQGGSGSSGAGQYFPTEKVSVSAGTKEGCGFKEWKLVSGSGNFADAGKADTTFDMGWEDAVISPEFCPLYTLTVEGGSAGKSSGIAGEETSLSLGDVPEGKAFSRWELSGSGTLSNPESPGCSFTFGDGDASVKAVYVDGQAAGNFVVGTEDADGFSYEGGVLKITGSGVYIVGMKIPGSSTGDRIEITGNNSTVVLNGVNINGGNNPAVRLETNKSAIIKLGGENRLSSSGSSGIYAMGESFGNTSTNLTITSLAGDGSTDGRLEVSGKTGIGCSSSNPTANIIINGGTIIASGNNSTLVYGGVGIGGAGKIGTGKNGTITINGGDITARGEGSSTYNPPCGFCTGGGEVKLTGEPSILIEGSYAHSMDTSARNVRIVYDGIGSSVRSVTVTPGKGQVTAGGTLQFQARVEGGGNADKSVVWSVDGNAAGTSIDADGLLTVAADETAAALTVTAVNSYSGLGATADVTVDKMTLVVTKWPHAAEATYGQPLNQIPLVGGTAVLRDENQADWPVKGSFSWDDGGRILDAGTHVCGVTFTAADGSLSASDTVQVTVKPAQLKIQWPTAGQNVVYTGRAAVVTPPTATLAGVEVAIDSFRYSCAENGSDDYISGLPTNAGTYAVKAGMEAQGNYTAAETAVPLVLTIEKAAGTLTVPGTPVSRKFGDAEFSLGCSTDGDGKISYVSDNVDVASVSPDGNVLITGAGKAVITVSLAEGVNYTGGASQKVEMIVEKAAAPSSMEETRNYAHTGGSGGAVIIDIGEKLPENRGETTYTFTKTDGNNILSGVSVDGDGTLSLQWKGTKPKEIPPPSR